MASSTRRRERAGFWWTVVLLLVSGVIAAFVLEARVSQGMVAREDAALSALRSLLVAAEEHRKRAGRFGWLEEMAAGTPLAVATEAGAQGLEGRSDGYRIELLLPTGRGPTGDVLLGAHGSTLDPLLAARHLALVARPRLPGKDGYRSYYLDETGRVFVQEGVADAEGLAANALPRARVERPGGAEAPGPIWRLLDDLDRNP